MKKSTKSLKDRTDKIDKAVKAFVDYVPDIVNNDLLVIEKELLAIFDEFSDEIEIKLLSFDTPLSDHMRRVKTLGEFSHAIMISKRTSKHKQIVAKTVLIGKGVVFDTGGYDIKQKMIGMHTDKAGAAAVIGTIISTTADDVIGLIGLRINLVSNTSLLPGSIVTSITGKKVEVANTDAEGRLLLADLLEIANKHLVLADDVDIITVATLTGMARYIGGTEYGLLFGNNIVKRFTAYELEELNIMLMPKFKKGGAPMSKRVPDALSNSASGYPTNGSDQGYKFLREFDQDVIHFDIAGVATDEHERATGYGVKQLIALVNALQSTK